MRRLNRLYRNTIQYQFDNWLQTQQNTHITSRYRMNDARRFSEEHQIPIITVDDLAVYAHDFWKEKGIVNFEHLLSGGMTPAKQMQIGDEICKVTDDRALREVSDGTGCTTDLPVSSIDKENAVLFFFF